MRSVWATAKLKQTLRIVPFRTRLWSRQSFTLTRGKGYCSAWTTGRTKAWGTQVPHAFVISGSAKPHSPATRPLARDEWQQSDHPASAPPAKLLNFALPARFVALLWHCQRKVILPAVLTSHLPGSTGVIRPRELTMKSLPALLLAACLWLSGCGQTGPLYLPEPAQPQPEAPAESHN